MCGIYGEISDRPAPAECGEVIRHRGPDDAGEQVFALREPRLYVSLLHRRLSIIDLSPAGHQPMSNEDGTVWAVFNGEIYNFQELREQLIAAGHRFQSRTDTETIIHGYEQWGEEVIPRLHGMFALAIWDGRQKRLLVARDRVGKKPLFYYSDGFKFLFGSEIKSLLASGVVPVRPDAEALHDYLTYLYFPAPRTAFAGICKLPPATTLVLQVGTDGRLTQQQKRFWDPVEAAGSARHLSRPEAVEQARELINHAVRTRLISDVPLGVFLSGGLDSGAITAFAARNSSHPASTFTVGFHDSKAFDETGNAALVAQKFATDHHVVHVDAQCAEHMATVVRHFDEPFGNPTAVLQYLLTREMRKSVTVALSGDGGDEAFGGYVRYAGAWMAQKYRRLPAAFTSGFMPRLSRLLHDDTRGRHGYRRVREFLESAWMPQEEMYLQWVGYFSETEKRSMYTSEFSRETGPRDSGNFLRELFRRGASLDPMARLGYVDMASFLAGNCLEYADRMSMANSLELRCPFADHRIQEFGLSLPFAWKYRHGKAKWILREAMKGILPQAILQGKKIGFNPPVPQWINRELRPLISELLSSRAVEQRGIFRPPAVAEMLQDHFEQKRDNALKIWGLLMLELWFQMYIDRKWDAPMDGLQAQNLNLQFAERR
ncbi:MAG TPA: asparagine synthase (glutamine-hydrolyzing) [Candidatus Angelobacter sp.]